MIYKIFRQTEWQEFQNEGATFGAPIDLADGYIHFSTASQVRETVGKHFAGVPDLMLLAFDEETMKDALKWEISRGGAKFPHLYRKLSLTELIWCKELPLAENGHQFPDDLS